MCIYFLGTGTRNKRFLWISYRADAVLKCLRWTGGRWIVFTLMTTYTYDFTCLLLLNIPRGPYLLWNLQSQFAIRETSANLDNSNSARYISADHSTKNIVRGPYKMTSHFLLTTKEEWGGAWIHHLTLQTFCFVETTRYPRLTPLETWFPRYVEIAVFCNHFKTMSTDRENDGTWNTR